jgi:hypothetical protein
MLSEFIKFKIGEELVLSYYNMHIFSKFWRFLGVCDRVSQSIVLALYNG